MGGRLVVALSLVFPGVGAPAIQPPWREARHEWVADRAMPPHELIGAPVAAHRGMIFSAGYHDSGSVWYSPNGDQWVQATGSAPFRAEEGEQLVSWNGRLLMLGRRIWESTDGAAWTEVVSDAPYGARRFHTVTEFAGALWIVGGEIPIGSYKNDVWRSEDGTSWTQVLAAAPFAGRRDHSICVHDGKLWLSGGFGIPGNFADVWSSPDGVSWTRETANGGFAARGSHGFLSQGDALFILGGDVQDGAGLFADVWRSTDGAAWERLLERAPFAGGRRSGWLARGGELWMLGSEPSSLWSSTDGIAWKHRGGRANLARQNPGFVVFGDAMVMVGGDRSDQDGSPAGTVSSRDGALWEVLTHTNAQPQLAERAAVHLGALWAIDDEPAAWSSPDGVAWTKRTAALPFGRRDGYGFLAHDGKLWFLGGSNLGTRYNDVWSSEDGVNWTQATAAAAFGPRGWHTVDSFQGRLWLIGGGTDSSATSREVWSSTDGVAWTLEVASAPFGNSARHATAVHDGKLWLFKEFNASTGKLSEVWNSPNGVDWTRVSENAYPPRRGFRAVSFGGRLVLAGGDSFDGAVYSSKDGIAWTQETGAASFPAGGRIAAAEWNGELWATTDTVISGGGAQVWRSANGSAWRLASAGSPFYSAGGQTGLLGFNDRLWAISELFSSRVFSSPDGVVWDLELNDAPWPNSLNNSAHAVHAGRMWRIAGDVSSTPQAQVYASDETGSTWTLVTASPGFTARTRAGAVAFDGALWLIGGQTNSGPSREVWRSTDGETWSLAAEDTGIPGDHPFGATVSRGRIWVAAGPAPSGRIELWSSANGVDWIRSAEEIPNVATSSDRRTLVAIGDRLVLLETGSSPMRHWILGAGIAPREDPREIDFGVVERGHRSASASVTLGNELPSAWERATVTAVRIEGSDAFAVAEESAEPFGLLPGEGRSIGVAFTPAAVGPQAGTLVIEFGDAAPEIRVPLAGVGAQNIGANGWVLRE